MTVGYRGSHSAVGCGSSYARTYQRGYYRAQWEAIERPILVATLESLRRQGARSLLDFACGTGRVTVVAETLFPRVVGVDVSEPMLEVARQECRSAEVRTHDVTRAPLDEQFDVVTAFRFFLNAEPALRDDALRAIRAMLRPGGTLLANVHVNESSPLGLVYRVRNRLMRRQVANTLGVSTMKKLLVSHGYRVESVTWYSFLPRAGWLFPPGWRALMIGVERVGQRLPAALLHVAQSFLIRATTIEAAK